MPDLVDAIRYSLNSDQAQLAVIAQNLANVNTSGYKKEMLVQKSFASALSDLDSKTDIQTPNSGLPILGSQRTFSTGALADTGDPFDLAMSKEYFLLASLDGRDVITRQGRMVLDGSGRLMLENGAALMGGGQEIYLNPGDFSIDQNGVIRQQGADVAKLDVVSVQNPNAMTYLGRGLFAGDSAGISEVTDVSSGVMQGYTEASNVNTLEEMVHMIEISRHFESSHNVLTGYDSMMNSAINVLGEF